MKTTGERLKKLRLENNLNQEGAAMTFHMDKSTWSRIESGRREPSIRLIEQVCQKWHVSADYLLFGEKNSENCVDLEGLTFAQIAAVKEIVKGLRRS